MSLILRSKCFSVFESKHSSFSMSSKERSNHCDILFPGRRRRSLSAGVKRVRFIETKRDKNRIKKALACFQINLISIGTNKPPLLIAQIIDRKMTIHSRFTEAGTWAGVGLRFHPRTAGVSESEWV